MASGPIISLLGTEEVILVQLFYTCFSPSSKCLVSELRRPVPTTACFFVLYSNILSQGKLTNLKQKPVLNNLISSMAPSASLWVWKDMKLFLGIFFLKDFILLPWLSSSVSRPCCGEKKGWAQGLRCPVLCLHRAGLSPTSWVEHTSGAFLGYWSPAVVSCPGKEVLARLSGPAVPFITQIKEQDVAGRTRCHGNTH